MHDYLVTGTCGQKDKMGSFSISIVAASLDAAKEQAQKDLRSAGYKIVTVSNAAISRRVN